MLRIPTNRLALEKWVEEVIDECMISAEERAIVYTRAAQYYYSGTYNIQAAIYNKTKGFIDKLSGFLMQPTDVRYNILYDTSEPDDVLERAQLASEKLSADYRQNDADTIFSEAVTWSLINGCQFLKHTPQGETFCIAPVHPLNFGVLGETVLNLDEQECFVHVTYPSMSQIKDMLRDHPQRNEIIARIEGARPTEKDQDQSSYFHQMVVGAVQPTGSAAEPAAAAGIVNVFPVPAPWRPNKRISPTVRFCEMWIKDAHREGDYTTLQVIYPDIIVEGVDTRRNLSRVPGKHPFVKVQSQPTPGYFWGRSLISDIQMLQDLLNKRLRDIKVMWDRNVNAPQLFSGFTSVTEEQYFKIINEGGFLNDPNPNAKASKMLEPPPEHYLEELQFIFGLFDEAAGFSPIMSGEGEPGVRAGVHAQTLVRTSSPRLIAQAARIERQLAESGYLAFRLMQAMDPSIYITADNRIEFTLDTLPSGLQVQVDSHSASPAFAEDNKQTAIALARAGAIDAEDLIHLLHPPSADLLLARLRSRQKAQAQAMKEEKQQEMVKDILQLPKRSQGGGGRRKR